MANNDERVEIIHTKVPEGSGEPLDTATEPPSPSTASNSPLVGDAASTCVEGGKARSDARLFDRLRRAFGSTPGYTSKYRIENIIPAVDELPESYGRVAAYESCDPNFLIYRKFAWLRNHVLLDLQDELRRLELDLERWYKKHSDERRRLISRRVDYAKKETSRKDLIRTIREKLAEYDELLLRMQQIHALKTPTKRNQNSLWNAVHYSESMTASETDWIRMRMDLAAIADDAEQGWLNGFVEDSLNQISKKMLLTIFRTPEQKTMSGDKVGFNLVSQARLDILIRAILTILACILLLVPVLILYELQLNIATGAQQNGKWQVGTIFIFTLLFSGSCSLFTKARRQEVFAATAAYCAVLVVFLGSSTTITLVTNGQSQPGSVVP